MPYLSPEDVAEKAAIFVITQQCERDDAVKGVIEASRRESEEATEASANMGLNFADTDSDPSAVMDNSKNESPNMPDNKNQQKQIFAVKKELLENNELVQEYAAEVDERCNPSPYD